MPVAYGQCRAALEMPLPHPHNDSPPARQPSESDCAFARRSPLLQGLEPGTVDALLESCNSVELAAGATLLAPGDHNRSLFLLVCGRLLVYLEEPLGKHYLALEPGDCAGEMSFVDGRAASAHVVAASDTRLLEIPSPPLWSLVDRTPEFARNLLRVLASRVRNDNKHLQRSFHLQREYEQAAKTDLLTGVHNRRWMDEIFPRQVARSQRSGQALALLMADIDHFKRLNDTYGHLSGDIVLKAVARLLSETLRPTDLLVRYGGEEFAAMLPGTTAETAAIAAERLRRAVERSEYTPSDVNSPVIRVTISVGVAILQAGEALPQLVERADSALYRAKAAGRNTVVLAEA